MNINKKYRLILLSLPISSLFIKSYLKNSDQRYENIFIYTTPKSNFTKLNFKDSENYKLCRLPFKNNEGRFLRYDLDFNISNLKSFFFFNKPQIKKYFNEVKNFKKFLLKNRINLDNVFEINYGWPNLAYLAFNIFSKKIVYNKFEHGCGDIRNTIKLNILIYRLKYHINNFFFFNFVNYPLIYNYTIFFNEIKKIIGDLKNIKKISTTNVKKEIKFIQNKITLKKKPETGKCIIIMIDYLDIKSFNDKNQIMAYFNSLFLEIFKNKNILINKKKIKNIYIKSKIHSSIKLFSKDIIIVFKEIFGKKLNLLFLENYINLNYNVEYILKLFNCVTILSSFSQGQFNSAKVFKFKNYMIDKWYLNYWKSAQKIDLIHVDYKWLFDFFFKRYKWAFKNILPTRL